MIAPELVSREGAWLRMKRKAAAQRRRAQRESGHGP